MRGLLSILVLPLLAALACAVAGSGPVAPPGSDRPRAWSFFEAPPEDVWSHKIADWQRRQRDAGTALAERDGVARLHTAEYALLLDKSDSFLLRERRALAARVLAFSQKEARRHYRWDPATDLAGDPWPTSRELYDKDGDDCDGLDLIAYDLLVAFGFPEESLYRVIVHRERDGAHHMATLWFEDGDDPWVIDATGAISRQMRRFSTLLGWTPIRLFDEDETFGVGAAGPAPAR